MTNTDKQILNRMLAQNAAIGSVFGLFLKRVSPLLERYRYEGELWARNAAIERGVEKELERLRANLETLIEDNAKWAWSASWAKNDELVQDYIKGLAISETLKKGMMQRNIKALDAFIRQKIDGLDLSDRVWDITRQTKSQLEFYLESGIGSGRSAAHISRDIRQILNEPDKRFHRIRDAKGNLVPSQPMRNYHPGQGVYRSAFKNAIRLSSTTINRAYRTADHDRWQGLDFVVGIEVKLSGAHPREDICDHMKGAYPKGFKFTGWHPFCLCYAVAILMNKDDFMLYVDGDDDTRQSLVSKYSVNGIPERASAYINENKKTIDGWKKPPLWVRDNFKEGKISNGITYNN